MDLARPLAYADDTFLQGAPAPTMQAFTALAAPLGLHMQPAKCAAYSTDGAVMPRSPATWACATHPTVSLPPAPPSAPRRSRQPTPQQQRPATLFERAAQMKGSNINE
jgi:hypothetical protein